MKKLLIFLSVLIVAFTAACEEDQFNIVRGSLVLEPLPSGNRGSWVSTADHELWLGEVPLYGREQARFRVTNPSNAITHIERIVQKNSKGSGIFVVESFPKEIFPDFNNPPDSFVVISYQPKNEWQDSNNNQRVDDKEQDMASFILYSDASGAGEMQLVVTGYGVDKGAPVLQVCYNNYCGPKADECRNGRCLLSTPLDFGNVSFGLQATQSLYIKNEAACVYPEEWSICQHQEYCALTIDRNIQNYNLGLAVLPGAGGSTPFSVFDGNSLPIYLPQNSASDALCPVGNSGEVRLNYQAVEKLQTDEGQLVLESNDPRAVVVTIPLTARSCQVPQAICRLRPADPLQPTMPYSEEGQLRPYSRIYLDGSTSFDKLDAQNSKAVSRYSWRIISYPEGANPADFGEHGVTSANFDFNAPLSGEYEVALTVWNEDGISSNRTEESICKLEVAPASKLHIQHTWDDPVNDQDLHLVYMGGVGKVCNKSSDCFWQNRQPVWFADYAAGTGPNPRLDHDDKDGLGPENLNIDEPLPGRYRLYVHYYEHPETAGNEAQPTMNTVRIYLNGILAGQYKHILNAPKEMWAAVDIIWDEVQPRVELLGKQSDSSGWICQVEQCNESLDVSCEAP